jgi:hypothetical protein
MVAELPKAFPRARVRTLHAKGGECAPQSTPNKRFAAIINDDEQRGQLSLQY